MFVLFARLPWACEADGIMTRAPDMACPPPVTINTHAAQLGVRYSSLVSPLYLGAGVLSLNPHTALTPHCQHSGLRAWQM